MSLIRGISVRTQPAWARPWRLAVAALTVALAAGNGAGRVGAAGFGVTPPEQFKTLEGFVVDLLYEVPEAEQGSWVAVTVDPQGRLIASDQYGGLYRIDVSGEEAKVEKLKIDFVGAQGLLCAFDALYANVNYRDRENGDRLCGIWRLTDTDGDDQYDKKEHLLQLNGGSEHGPHAMIVSPDGKRIITCAGNNTDLPKSIVRSRVPRHWGEDHLLGRMPDARGHNAGRLGPGGFIVSLNPDGSEVELIATGFRNSYDVALNRAGELFTYDADMEWDVGTPWYRPTRINHVISGAEFGWRNGTGKWPSYYPDSFGSAVDIGPGSPTGICFGYGTNFPEQYQNALFICDWSYGNIHAVHLTPEGSSYSGSYETFATAAPLPVTDIVTHPDGALYFTIGGRRTQSGLYRIRYTGQSKASPSEADDAAAAALRETRAKLESFHVGEHGKEVIPVAIEHLSNADRAIRFAARIALEHQPVEFWRNSVTRLADPQARILGIVALARSGKSSDQVAATEALAALDWSGLTTTQRTDLLRAYGLVAMRLGEFNGDQREAILAQLGEVFPTGDNPVDRELAQVLVYLNAPGAVGKIVAQLRSSPSQENQIHYAMTLRNAKQGWNQRLRRQYFSWFNEIQSARGGMSFGGFINNIKDAALEHVDASTKSKLAGVINPPNQQSAVVETPQRELVQQWTVDDLVGAVSDDQHQPNFTRGKDVFAAALCYKCHRMGLQGGILGPDLTAAGGRFSPKDLLVSIIDPNKEISDQYGATQFLTDDGQIVVGRVVNMSGPTLRVMTNMLDPSSQTDVRRDSILEARPAGNSMMPANLLDTFTKEEIADLVAYLRAGGNSAHPIYQQAVAAQSGGL